MESSFLIVIIIVRYSTRGYSIYSEVHKFIYLVLIRVFAITTIIVNWFQIMKDLRKRHYFLIIREVKVKAEVAWVKSLRGQMKTKVKLRVAIADSQVVISLDL